MASSALLADKHVARIDVLRGVAILLVLAFHFFVASFGHDIIDAGTTSALPKWLLLLLYPVHFGSYGVSLFFVISGYVIHRSYLRDRQFRWRNYASRRFWRIYPAYFVALLGFAGLMHLIPTSNFALHAALVHNISGSSFFGINPSFWSLAVEVQLYVLYPLAIFVRRFWGAGGMLAAGLMASLVWRVVASFYTDWPQPGNQHIWTSPVALWPDWLLGAYLAEKHASGKRGFRQPLLWAGGAAVLFVLGEFIKPLHAVQFSLASLVAAVLMELYLHREAPLGRSARVLSFIGICSYSLYLIHQPFLKSFIRILERVGVHEPITQFAVGFPFFVVIGTAAAWVMYKVVEQGGVTLGKKLGR